MRRAWVMTLFIIMSAPAMVPAQQEKVVCGLENCHGIDITCGPNVAQVCTELYQLGDLCRAYARCEIVDGLCRQQLDPDFEQCAACVRTCLEEYPQDAMGAFGCEAQCLQAIEQELPEDGERGKYRGMRSKGFGR